MEQWTKYVGEMRRKREKGIELEHEFDTQQALAVLIIWANPDPYIIFGKSSSLYSV